MDVIRQPDKDKKLHRVWCTCSHSITLCTRLGHTCIFSYAESDAPTVKHTITLSKGFRRKTHLL